MGALTIIGIILYGDSDDLLKCLIAARAELCNNDTITNPVFFCEPDPSIAVACFKAFIQREESLIHTKARLFFSLARIH